MLASLLRMKDALLNRIVWEVTAAKVRYLEQRAEWGGRGPP